MPRMKHHGESARKRPAKLQHRNIKGKTGHGKPAGIAFVRYASGHAGKKVHHVSVRDHHALGLARRSRGVNHIGCAVCASWWQGGTIVWRVPSHRVHKERLFGTKLEPGCQRCAGHDQRRLGVLNHEGQTVSRVFRVERQIGGTCLLNGQQSHHEIGRTLEKQAHYITGLDAAGDQAPRNGVSLVIDLLVRKILPAKAHRRMVGRARRLSGYGFMDAPRSVKRDCRGVERRDHFSVAGRHQGKVGKLAVCGFKNRQIKRQLPGYRLNGFFIKNVGINGQLKAFSARIRGDKQVQMSGQRTMTKTNPQPSHAARRR